MLKCVDDSLTGISNEVIISSLGSTNFMFIRQVFVYFYQNNIENSLLSLAVFANIILLH